MSLLNEIFNKITNPSNYIIDIGASSGVNTDPIYEFIINSKYNGLCIEGNKNNIHYLKQKTKFNICDEYIYPHNIFTHTTKKTILCKQVKKKSLYIHNTYNDYIKYANPIKLLLFFCRYDWHF